MGSSTINRGILTSVAGILEEILGLVFKNKKAAAFGSYGWSGEGVKMISNLLKEGGFEVVNEGLGVLWNPDRQPLENCLSYGMELAQALR